MSETPARMTGPLSAMLLKLAHFIVAKASRAMGQHGKPLNVPPLPNTPGTPFLSIGWAGPNHMSYIYMHCCRHRHPQHPYASRANTRQCVIYAGDP
jgi:hypothetical protein